MGFGVIGLVLLYLGSFFSDPAVAKILDISSLAEVRTPTPSFSTSSDADFAANQYPGEVPHITEIAFYIDQPALEKARELLGVVDAWTILGDETQQILTDYIHRTVLKSNRSFAMSGVPSILHVVDIVFSDGVHFGLGLHPDIHQSIQETQPDIIAFVLDDIPGPAAGSASWENQSLRIEVEQIIRSGENPQFSNHVFSHEVGHILKMNHDPNAHNYPCTNTHCGTYFAVPTVCDPLSPHFSDEACPNEASHRTLMAYPDPEVGFFRSQSFVFSGPDIRYSHTWTGTAVSYTHLTLPTSG